MALACTCARGWRGGVCVCVCPPSPPNHLRGVPSLPYTFTQSDLSHRLMCRVTVMQVFDDNSSWRFPPLHSENCLLPTINPGKPGGGVPKVGRREHHIIALFSFLHSLRSFCFVCLFRSRPTEGAGCCGDAWLSLIENSAHAYDQ